MRKKLGIVISLDSIHSDRWIAQWHDDEARYHIWLTPGKDNPDRIEPSDVLFVNPPLNADGTHIGYGKPGHFETRRRNLTSKSNQHVRDAILAAIEAADVPAMRAAAVKAEEDRQALELRVWQRARLAAAVKAISEIPADVSNELALDKSPEFAAALETFRLAAAKEFPPQ